MLAKYNLYVGGSYDGTNWTEYGEEATGLQDSTMIAYLKDGAVPRKGTTSFLLTQNWENLDNGTYVYDSSSNVYTYIENYKNYLIDQGTIVDDARPIAYDELINLGCSGNSCKNAPSWIFTTSYWTGATSSDAKIWYVDCSGYFNSGNGYTSNYFGVRPVITIPKYQF